MRCNVEASWWTLGGCEGMRVVVSHGRNIARLLDILYEGLVISTYITSGRNLS